MVMKRTIIAVMILAACAGARVRADASATSQPSANLAAELQLEANEDMGRGNYMAAAPLLQKVAQLLSAQPDQLGPVLEQLRMCRHQILAAASKSALPGTSGSTSVA